MWTGSASHHRNTSSDHNPDFIGLKISWNIAGALLCELCRWFGPPYFLNGGAMATMISAVLFVILVNLSSFTALMREFT